MKSATYRPEIDGLRALAVLAVIINHINKDWLPSGYLGVDIFFVISGLVITTSLIKRPVTSFRDELLSFYARRIKRLLPAMIVCVVVTSVLVCLFDPAPGVSLQTGLTALFGASNLYLYSLSTDYFAPSTELNTFTHTWSLGVEEQFYLLYPLLLWLAGFWHPEHVNGKARIRNSLILLLFLTTISLIGFLAFHESQPSAVYFLMPLRFWELGSGCILALLADRAIVHAPAAWALPSSWFSLTGLLLLFFLPEQQARLATVGATMLTGVLITSLRSESTPYRLLSHPVAVGLGVMSYSLYLWHWSVLSLSRWTIGIHIWSLPIQIALILILSIISYRYVEKPLRLANWHDSRAITIVKGLLAASGGAAILILLGRPLEGRLFTGNGGKEVEQSRLASDLVASGDYLHKSTESQLKACNMTPFLLGSNSYTLRRPVDATFIQDCVGMDTDDPKQGPRLLLVGDSFTEKTAQHAALAAKKLGIGFKLLYGYGCPYLLKSDKINKASFRQCRHASEDILENTVLNSLAPGDVLLLHLHLTSKSYVKYPSATINPSPSAYDQAIESLLAKASARNARVILIGPNPNLATQELMALKPEWFNVLNRTSKIPPNNIQETIYFHTLDRHLSVKAKQWGPHQYLSLKPHICNSKDECLLSKGKRFLYSDDHHLSPFGHDLFFPALMEAIRSAQISPSREK